MAAPKKTAKKNAKKKTRSKRRASSAEPEKSCFVMMPFKAPFDTYYSAIFKPAIEEAGMKPVRADDLFRPSVIVSDIWAMIQDGDVLLAELTTKNANVFYELGLSHAVGKPVILVSETMDDVPFDLQQLRVLLYNKDDPSWGDKLRESIVSAVKETLENPIEGVPPIFRKKVESFAPEQEETAARLEALESQVRLLRTQTARASSSRSPWRDELNAVNSGEMLEDWADKWYQQVPLRVLIREIKRHPQIPDGEALRIQHIFENTEQGSGGKVD